MRLPLSLIKAYIDPGLSLKELCETLMLIGIEVDSLEEGPDPVLELSFTPNLGHCLSGLGVARELSSVLRKKLHLPTVSPPPSDAASHKIKLLNKDLTLCPRYLCRIVEQVTIGPSPEWLQNILTAAGFRPINNAVDVGNYLMIKTGQPFHFFDYDKIDKRTIHIGPTSHSEPFFGLDQVEQTLPAGTLLISDSKGPIAIAGLLGAERASVTSETKNILIEAAYFDPASIRSTSKKLQLRTESSFRFDRGIDPSRISYALDEACELVAETSNGRPVKGSVQIGKETFPDREIPCRIQRVNQILGTHLSQNEVEEIFQALGFPYKEKVLGTLQVFVPFYRRDLAEEIDLIEDIAKLYGYNRIERKTPLVSLSPLQHDPLYLFSEQVRAKLSGFGLQEMLTSNLIGPKWAEITGSTSIASVLHPKSEEHSLLRPSLLPTLLQAVKLNQDQQTTSYRSFEIGKIYLYQQNKVVEILSGAITLVGDAAPSHFSLDEVESDFFELKGLLENLFSSFSLTHFVFEPSQYPQFHPGRQAHLDIDGVRIASLGEIHPLILNQLGIKRRVLFAECNLEQLFVMRPKSIRMHPLSQFPASERDWTLILPPKFPISELFDLIRENSPPLLEKVQLIDLYESKNATLRFTYRDALKTVAFEAVEKAHTKLVEEVSCKLKAKTLN